MDCKEEDNDYINASFINGYYNRVEFISTQHPLPTTRDDFWRMVIERSSSTIVVFGPLKDPEVCYYHTFFCIGYRTMALFRIDIGLREQKSMSLKEDS